MCKFILCPDVEGQDTNTGTKTGEDEDDDGGDVVGQSILAEVKLAKVPSKYDSI